MLYQLSYASPKNQFTIAKVITEGEPYFDKLSARLDPGLGAMIPARMPRRTKATIIIVFLVLLLVALAAYLRRKAPPEAARLLPESDCILYFNLRPLRSYTHFDRHPVPRDPQYQAFINATGFEFERDLDEAAFALHRMPNPLGPNGAVAYSEVFLGHIDRHRLGSYLASIAADTEEYAGHTIYNIPSNGRTVRVALLGYDMVAASNTPTPEQIHSMLDRYRHLGAAFFRVFPAHRSLPGGSFAFSGLGDWEDHRTAEERRYSDHGFSFSLGTEQHLHRLAALGRGAPAAGGGDRPYGTGGHGFLRCLEYHGGHWPGGGE